MGKVGFTMADNSFNNTVESLFKGMDSFITTKTVVGDAIHIGDTIILPLVDVFFWCCGRSRFTRKRKITVPEVWGEKSIRVRFLSSRME